jgi:hypothetical protein
LNAMACFFQGDLRPCKSGLINQCDLKFRIL